VQTQLARIFFTQVDVLGSTMGTRSELEQLLAFLVATGVRPVIDTELALTDARDGFAKMADGDLFGKVVFTI